ncbi:DUF4055 domain-containing protein [Pseudomonas sp. DCB_CB]|uniref:DUF4055 domain-containing protein n=1 Tax=unclassified Pseudomonas TaxID=196821 RepID=UPI002248A39A|nr:MULTISPECIES: DUF4055 domain-containing protein [unclassified Pseudomonas]MCX2693666.1 DUF4055 domain-containing protein [Pseudomonas sp. DCB_BZ]MCX2858832.1 DUF4055 domain-containing protein [Pseudomonas sp. DCB_CB]
MSNDNPAITLPAVDRMREHWAIVDPLMGGTQAMRAAGKALLPQYPAEKDDTYAERLKLSTLLPAYAETVGNNTSRVFAEPLQLGEDVPEQIKALCTDIDLGGNDLNSWSVEWFREALAKGLCHALIEHHPTRDAEGNKLYKTKAEEEGAGVRPYAVIIKPGQVLGWRYEGARLVQFRYLETVEEQDGQFGVKCVDQVRVLEPGHWRTYRAPRSTGRSAGGAWELFEEGATSLSYIPLVTFYTGRTGPLTAKPPLLELAHLNVKHWQSQSDQDNLLHVARVPLLFVFTDDDQFQLTISSASATRMPKDGNAKYVEHTGQAITAGRDSLNDLVEDMRMAGAKLLQKDKQQTKTAAQANEEAAQELSPLARLAGQFADCLAQLLQIMADYQGQTQGGHVEMRGNFDSDFAPEVSLPNLISMANSGKISDETLYSEMQRRGVISDELDWEAEKARIEEQGPALGAI